MSLPNEIVRLECRTKVQHVVRDARAAARGPHRFDPAAATFAALVLAEQTHRAKT
jgi:hypothetical protein